MPRTYVRKVPTRGNITDEVLQTALDAIASGRKIREVGRSFNISEATLRYKIRMNQRSMSKLGRKPIFTEEQEKELTKHILELAKMFYGITIGELRQLVYKYADTNEIRHNFCKETELAGKDWVTLFLKRNPEVSLRKPEGTSINRIIAFNKIEVKRFYSNIASISEKFEFHADRMYNVDETGITTVQRPSRILGPKGQKQVGSAISLERGKTVTIVCAMSASGGYIPPMFIFPRKRMNAQLQNNGPIGAIYHCSDNGWINNELFYEWLKHFKCHVHPSPQSPVLLLLDNHTSHISLEIYSFCKANSIHLISIPPHTSHRLQPLDLSFFSPLKGAYNKECELYLRAHPHQRITNFQLAEIFNKAYLKVATMEKGIAGFRSAGICPFDPDKFKDEDFLPAQQFLPVALENEVEEHRASDTEQLKDPSITENSIITPEAVPQVNSEIDPIPGTSKENVSFSDLLPLPKVHHTISKKTRARTKKRSEILTSTPMKKVLEEADLKREKRNEKKAAATKRKDVSQRCKKSTHVKKIKFQDSETEESEFDEKDICDDDELDDVDPTRPENICLICGEFGKDRELWYQCASCLDWAHADCTLREDSKPYICDICVE